MLYSLFIPVIAGFLAAATAWGVGSADLANILSTSIGSKAIKLNIIILIAIIFEFSGAFFGGSHVSHTLHHDIINLSLLQNRTTITIAMLSISAAAASWMLIASGAGLPASITNAIVGSLVGFGCVVFGTAAVHWHKIFHIMISWIFSPISCAIFSYLLFSSIQRLILRQIHPERYIKRYFPIYCFVVGLIFSYMMINKIFDHFNWLINYPHFSWLSSIISGLFLTILGVFIGRKDAQPSTHDRRAGFDFVEKKFGILLAFTLCAMVFAHGSNDVPIAVAPFNIIMHTISTLPSDYLNQNLAKYSLSLGSLSVILGFLFYGRRVIHTVGSGITSLTPSRAFSATIATAVIVIFSTSAGIPISVTQTLVGGILGVGLARGIGALNLTVVRNIFLSWFITIPATSLLSIIYFYLIKYLTYHLPPL